MEYLHNINYQRVESISNKNHKDEDERLYIIKLIDIVIYLCSIYNPSLYLILYIYEISILNNTDYDYDKNIIIEICKNKLSDVKNNNELYNIHLVKVISIFFAVYNVDLSFLDNIQIVNEVTIFKNIIKKIDDPNIDYYEELIKSFITEEKNKFKSLNNNQIFKKDIFNKLNQSKALLLKYLLTINQQDNYTIDKIEFEHETNISELYNNFYFDNDYQDISYCFKSLHPHNIYFNCYLKQYYYCFLFVSHYFSPTLSSNFLISKINKYSETGINFKIQKKAWEKGFNYDILSCISHNNELNTIYHSKKYISDIFNIPFNINISLDNNIFYDTTLYKEFIKKFKWLSNNSNEIINKLDLKQHKLLCLIKNNLLAILIKKSILSDQILSNNFIDIYNLFFDNQCTQIKISLNKYIDFFKILCSLSIHQKDIIPFVIKHSNCQKNPSGGANGLIFTNTSPGSFYIWKKEDKIGKKNIFNIKQRSLNSTYIKDLSQGKYIFSIVKNLDEKNSSNNIEIVTDKLWIQEPNNNELIVNYFSKNIGGLKFEQLGVIELFIEGGTPPYLIFWKDLDENSNQISKREGLKKGKYYVHIIDKNLHMTNKIEINIQESEKKLSAITKNGDYNYLDKTLFAKILPINGELPYNIQWFEDPEYQNEIIELKNKWVNNFIEGMYYFRIIDQTLAEFKNKIEIKYSLDKDMSILYNNLNEEFNQNEKENNIIFNQELYITNIGQQLFHIFFKFISSFIILLSNNITLFINTKSSNTKSSNTKSFSMFNKSI